MKYIIPFVMASLITLLIPASGEAANINARNTVARYSSYEGTKLPGGVIMYPNAQQKALFANESKTDIKTALLNAGAQSANVYTILIKDENEMNYSIFTDLVVGLSHNLVNTKHVSRDNSQVGNLITTINNGQATELGNYRVVTPLTKQGNTYVGVLKYTNAINNNSYNEILHISISESKYAGPNVRFIAVDEDSDAKVFSKISHLLTQKNK
ncbi:hypothetical protein [Veillonella caviae]|uniref:hypothetical protein n=1 Tax=Veillonella caviae TaxID=248316 RepID=UPI002A83D4BC|nr:hypothetical protein [Veillonella caviae]MDY4745907.1 hypothetical protein [Veillonella caviae]